jgi:hypothetical protein
VDAVLVRDTVAVPVLETDAVDDAEVVVDAVAVSDFVDVAVFEIEGVRLAVAEREDEKETVREGVAVMETAGELVTEYL